MVADSYSDDNSKSFKQSWGLINTIKTYTFAWWITLLSFKYFIQIFLGKSLVLYILNLANKALKKFEHIVELSFILNRIHGGITWTMIWSIPLINVIYFSLSITYRLAQSFIHSEISIILYVAKGLVLSTMRNTRVISSLCT